MKSAVKLAVTLALISGSFLATSPAAQAQLDWTQVPAYLDVQGRFSDIAKQISESLAAGRLTQAQADKFTSSLQGIKDLDSNYRTDGKLSVFERMRLILNLDNLTKDIQGSLSERNVAITDVSGRRSEISKEITEAVLSGRLTNQEATTFKSRLDEINAREEKMRSAGPLSTTQTLQLSLDLDRLDSDIQSSLRTRVISDPGVDKRKDEIATRIDDLVAKGTLSAAQAEPLKQELNRINARESAFKASGGTLDSEEVLTLALELEKLSGRIDRYAPPPQTQQVKSIDERQADLKKRIADGQTGGKLTLQQYNDLNQEFNRIEALEAMFRADQELSDNETLTLARDLDALGKRVDDALASSTPSAPGLNARLDAVTKRIADARSAGRFSPASQADEMEQELQRIKDKETFYRADGSLNDTETLILASDIDNLNKRLDAAISALPDLSKRKADIEQKLNTALASGRINAKKSANIRRELQRISFLESSLKGNDGVLSDQEIAAVARDYDFLEKRLDKSLPALPDVDKMQSELLAKLDAGKKDGKLSQSSYDSLKKEYDRIADVEKTFRESNASLSDWEAMSLKRELDELGTNADKLISQGAGSAQGAGATVDLSAAAPDTKGHWAQKYIAVLQNRNVIGGFPDGSFKPDKGITRAQFAAIAQKALDLPPAGREANFNDLPKKHWAYKAVSAVSEAGLVTGFPDGTFRPEDKITRAQALVILAKALQNEKRDDAALKRYKDTDKVPTWAIPSVSKAAGAGIIVNYPDPYKMRPDDLATRAEVAALTYQTMARLGKDLPHLDIGLEASDDKSTD